MGGDVAIMTPDETHQLTEEALRMHDVLSMWAPNVLHEVSATLLARVSLQKLDELLRELEVPIEARLRIADELYEEKSSVFLLNLLCLDPDGYTRFQALAETIALLSGLMLAVALAFPTSVETSELDEVVERFAEIQDEHSIRGDFRRDYGKDLVTAFAQDCALAYFMLSSSLFVDIIAYLSSFTLDLTHNSLELRAWWSIVRWLVVYAKVTLIVGCVFCGSALYRLIQIKFRDYVFQKNAGFGPVYGFSHVTMLVLNPGAAIVAAIVASCSILAFERVRKKKKAKCSSMRRVN